jgi:hypothetical protein
MKPSEFNARLTVSSTSPEGAVCGTGQRQIERPILEVREEAVREILHQGILASAELLFSREPNTTSASPRTIDR